MVEEVFVPGNVSRSCKWTTFACLNEAKAFFTLMSCKSIARALLLKYVSII